MDFWMSYGRDRRRNGEVFSETLYGEGLRGYNYENRGVYDDKIEENPSNARGIATEGEKVYPNGAKVSFALKPEIIPDGDSLARTTVMKPMAKREFSMTNARDTPLLSDTKLNPFSDSHVDNLPKVDSNREAIDENNENKGNLRSRAWRLFVEML
nr:hypothetical protein Iba_chr02aCG12770 [Ipomoea batatas]GMC67034.1 hypothetical protein Iba_chr02eCG11240 [Ipomoea batatas]